MSVRKGGSWCSVYGCRNNSNMNKNISFFRYPKNPDRSNAWILATGRRDLLKKGTEYAYKNCRVCSLHFEPEMFANDLKNRLHNNAIPKIVISEERKDCSELSTESEQQNSTEANSRLDSDTNISDDEETKTYHEMQTAFYLKLEDTSWEQYYKEINNYSITEVNNESVTNENQLVHLNLDEYSIKNKKIYTKCTVCNKKMLLTNLEMHRKTHDEFKNNSNCIICDEMFVDTTQNSQNKMYLCTFCTKVFKNVQNCNEHEKTHDNSTIGNSNY